MSVLLISDDDIAHYINSTGNYKDFRIYAQSNSQATIEKDMGTLFRVKVPGLLVINCNYLLDYNVMRYVCKQSRIKDIIQHSKV